MPQTAKKDTGEEPVFFMLACVQHESVYCTCLVADGSKFSCDNDGDLGW